MERRLAQCASRAHQKPIPDVTKISSKTSRKSRRMRNRGRKQNKQSNKNKNTTTEPPNNSTVTTWGLPISSTNSFIKKFSSIYRHLRDFYGLQRL